MFIADLHIHSKYSRATSKACVPEMLELAARRKGLDLVGTGDFTHHGWREELREKLTPTGDGLYRLKSEYRQQALIAGEQRAPHFIVSGEISSIYKKNGKVRKVHNLILLPGLEAAEALSRRLEDIGNLHSDGRPILGLDSRDLLEITLEACPEAIFIPAHIWTPHFSLFGAYSGFDDIAECFEDLTGHIHALETGLSSDPPMNWRLSALDRFALVSNSDAHSPEKLAREANLFETELSYPHLARALEHPEEGGFRGTIEFFPEEGKYHLDGHRSCKVCQSPAQTLAAGGKCPVCGGRITVGVLHRVEALADRAEGYVLEGAPRFESLVPLPEVIVSSTGASPSSIRGRELYGKMLARLGPELMILRTLPLEQIGRVAGPAVAEGIRRLRQGKIYLDPGYDGEYGRVRILEQDEIAALSGQTLFALDTGRVARTAGIDKPARSAPPVKERAPVKPKRRKEPKTARYDALASLNPEQSAAVASQTPVIAVIAGPGAGKTKTLVARIAHLVQRCGVPPAHITAVTFTNKAASEMRQRLAQHFGDAKALEGMTIGTFHGVCLRLLQRDGREVSLADGASVQMFAEEAIRTVGAKISVRDALRGISLQKCVANPLADLPDALYEEYCRLLREQGALDFDDILLQALEAGTQQLGEEERAHFSHLLVDEFQDINPVQYRLVRQWREVGKSLFVIGDPNQSVYGFRGSDARCFDWLRGDEPDMERIILTRNYRSTPEILAAAAPLASAQLYPERTGGAKVRLVNVRGTLQEAVYIVKQIGRMVGGIDMQSSGMASAVEKARGFSDIAILYRTNRQAAILEDCLTQEGIPYVVTGREDFLSQPEVARTLAFFKLLLSPENPLALRIALRAFPNTGEGAQVALEQAVAHFAPLLHKETPQTLIGLWTAQRATQGEPWAQKLVRIAQMQPTIEDMLRAVALGQEGDVTRCGGKRYTGDAVSLMTLHGAKGLEFPVAFLCGVTEGLIPYKGYAHEPADVEEERRLLYVGMTRAKDELVLINHGEASSFLTEIPDGRMEAEALRPDRVERLGKQLNLFDELNGH